MGFLVLTRSRASSDDTHTMASCRTPQKNRLASASIPLSVGENTIRLMVMAWDDSTSTVTLAVIRRRRQTGKPLGTPFADSPVKKVDVELGSAVCIDDEGEVAETDVAVGESELGEVIAGAVDQPIMATAGAERGAARVDEADEGIILTAGFEGVVSCEGFQPESQVEIQTFSEPRLMGVVTV